MQYVPSTFFEKHFDHHGSINVILRTADAPRIYWEVKLTPLPKARFTSGWTKFQRDNDLKEGEVCLFEMVKGNKISFKVRIYRSFELVN